MLPELGLIFDAGTGMFRVRDLIETDTLDIFLSHVHLDHSIGLTFLYDILSEKQMSRVTVHVDSEKIEIIERHLYHQQLFPVPPNFELRPLGDCPAEISPGVKISSIPLEHPGGSHGFRLDGPEASFAYITDTTADVRADYVRAISGVETLIHECNFADGWEEKALLTGHSCLTPVAKVAATANVGRLFLVHVNPLDETDTPFDLGSVEAIFRPITVARDHMVIEV